MVITDFLKSERFQRLSKEGFWIVLGQVLAIAGALFGIRIITELLSPAVYGELALGMTVALLANQLVFGPLVNGVARFYSTAVEKGKLPGYVSAVRRLLLSAALLILLVSILTAVVLYFAGAVKWVSLVVVAAIFSVLAGYSSAFSSLQNAARQRFVASLHLAMDSWARFLIAAGLVVLFGATSVVAMAGYAVSLALVLLSQFYFSKKILPYATCAKDDEIILRNQIVSYSWPFVAWGGFSWMQFASDRWALQFFAAPRDVGLYAVLFQLGYYPASLLTGMATQLLAPILYQRVGDASDPDRIYAVNKLGWRLTGFALAVTAVGFFIVLFLHLQIFALFVAKKYSTVSYLLPWMLLAGGVFAAAQTVALNLMSQMKTQAMTTCKIATSIIGVLANFAGAYLFGIPGIVGATAFSSVIYFLWISALALRISPMRLFDAGFSAS